LGVHWLSDVIGGWAYGIVVLGLLVAAVAGAGTDLRPGPGRNGRRNTATNQTGGQMESHGR
ncbi:MAG: hypothetical protein ACQSGP_03690, partial [Frankia sp.]